MAVVGQGYAVLQSGPVRVKGALAWVAWAGVHVLTLAQPSLRLSVFLQWMWTFCTRQRGSRLIVKPRESANPGKPLDVALPATRVG
jgi:hypothetical protein